MASSVRAMNFNQPPQPEGASAFILEDAAINLEYPVHVFLVDPFEDQPVIPLLYISEFDGKILVAVPYSAWSRQVSKRALPAGCIVKATVVEVLCCRMSSRSQPLEEPKMKLWVGFLKRQFEKMVHTNVTDFTCDHFFDDTEDDPLLPYAQSLIDAAQDHFAFFSAGEAQEDAQDDAEMIPDLDDGDPEQGGSGSVQLLSKRVTKIETVLEEVNAGMRKLLNPNSPSMTAAGIFAHPSVAKKPADRKAQARGQREAFVKPTPKNKAQQFPLLDPGVVQAALQAGVPESNLIEMQKLLASNPKAMKMKDINPALHVVTDPLSEEEAEDPVEDVQAAESGFVETGDPMQDAVQRLTSIVHILANDKKKKSTGSKLEQALDGVATSTGESSSSLGSGKKNAAARRCLRNVFQEHPVEISNVIEKLMYEDLNSMTLGPGQQPLGLNARAWVEYRSRISNYKTSAHASWGIAGVLDSLIGGDISKARARCCLLLLQLDQASIDKGNWSFSSDLSMEGLPPFSALANHQGPSLVDGEQPFSRLLDSRWAEITLGFLKEQDDFLLRRKNIGKIYAVKGKEGEQDDADPKRRPKAKAKNKQSAGSQQDA